VNKTLPTRLNFVYPLPSLSGSKHNTARYYQILSMVAKKSGLLTDNFEVQIARGRTSRV